MSGDLYRRMLFGVSGRENWGIVMALVALHWRCCE